MVKQANLAYRRLFIKSRLAISSPDELLVTFCYAMQMIFIRQEKGRRRRKRSRGGKIQVRYRKSPRDTCRTENRKTKTNTNPSADPD